MHICLLSIFFFSTFCWCDLYFCVNSLLIYLILFIILITYLHMYICYVHLRTSAVFSFYYVFCFFFLFSGLTFPLKIHTFSSFLPAAFFCFHLSFLFILSQTDSFLPHPFPTSTPSVGKWHAVKVPEWTDSHLDGVALLGPNSLAPVAMWTCNHPLPRQQHLPRSPPNTSIRKMGKPSLNASLPREVHSRDRQDVKLK